VAACGLFSRFDQTESTFLLQNGRTVQIVLHPMVGIEMLVTVAPPLRKQDLPSVSHHLFFFVFFVFFVFLVFVCCFRSNLRFATVKHALLRVAAPATRCDPCAWSGVALKPCRPVAFSVPSFCTSYGFFTPGFQVRVPVSPALAVLIILLFELGDFASRAVVCACVCLLPFCQSVCLPAWLSACCQPASLPVVVCKCMLAC